MKKNDIQAAIDSARLMTRLSISGGVIALVLLVLVIVVMQSRPAGPDVFPLAAVPLSLALLFSLSGMIYGMLRHSAALEEEEKLLLENRKKTNALDVQEDVRFTAGRSFQNYRRFAPYALTMLGAVSMLVWLIALWRYWAKAEAAVKTATHTGNPLNGALVAAVLMLVAVFAGAFFVGQSRDRAYRWLRPVGAWLLATFAVLFMATLAGIFAHLNYPRFDIVAAKVIFWVFAVLGAEFVVSFIMEFYRPRTIEEPRPIFESKLLALFTEPGGVMRNIALALDYQFGFKVSGTWLYSFLERSFFPLLLVWAAILWGFTMIHEVDSSEVGLRENLGRRSGEILEPGVYWTLPWPFGVVKRYSCTQIQQIEVGHAHDEAATEEEEYVDDGHGHAPPAKKKNENLSTVVLWTKSHGAGAENNFVVAVPATEGQKEDIASISFIGITMPVRYRIRRDGVMDFVYRHSNALRTLRKISEQAATEYLTNTSMEIMSVGRRQAEAAMQKRIQTLADSHLLGVEIISVTLLDAHPPVEEVAPAYQKVIAAMEQKESTILDAEAYAIKTVPAALSAAQRLKSEAQAYQESVSRVARAESERFLAQSKAYEAMPSMFKLNAYLDFLERELGSVRKFVVADGLRDSVYELNFEKSERFDIIDTDITSVK